MNQKAILVKIGKISGMYYQNSQKTDTIVVYGIGAPIIPDGGNLPDSPFILKYKTDLFVPDYIGYGRSDGVCTPLNCIKTFLQLYEAFDNGTEAINRYAKSKIKLQYKRIIFVGRSFGGTYIPLLPRFNKNIKELGIIYPAVDNKSCGSMPGEESNEDFMNAMRYDGYHYLYRGILAPKWKKHLNNEDGLSPMDNIAYLKDAKLFISHGTADTCIHFSKSVIYFNNIQKKFPDKKNQFLLKLYKGTGHTPETSNKAVNDFLKWLKLERI